MKSVHSHLNVFYGKGAAFLMRTGLECNGDRWSQITRISTQAQCIAHRLLGVLLIRSEDTLVVIHAFSPVTASIASFVHDRFAQESPSAIILVDLVELVEAKREREREVLVIDGSALG